MSSFRLSNELMTTPVDGVYKEGLARILREFLLSKYKKDDNLPCEIQEGLFLGSIGAAYNKDELVNLKITHILSIVNIVEAMYPSDFKYKQIEVRDSADVDLEEHFDACFTFINEARQSGGAVLVHCFAGRSRSVTVVVAYLMKTYGMNFSQALDLVRTKRPQAAPNPGFVVQLKKFERKLRVPYIPRLACCFLYQLKCCEQRRLANVSCLYTCLGNHWKLKKGRVWNKPSVLL